MRTDPCLVDAQEIHVHYGESHVLRGVSLAIRAGETVGLLGRNGMGKSTLIRTIMGHVRASRGRIAIRGTDGARMRPDRVARAGIAYVPEGRAIFPNLSVRENLQMAARAGRDGRRDWTFDRVLSTFPRLAERLGHGGAQLSGGEQQMLTIGRALLTNPELLILDEATEGLAPLIAREIWRIVREIRATGIATVIVDKNYAHVSALTDRNVVLVRGQVAYECDRATAQGDPAALARFLGV
jgi:branched-chain amino acid transport system ATP-binding protein